MKPGAFDTAVFDPALRRWALVADGDPIVTRAARLLPVRRAGEPFIGDESCAVARRPERFEWRVALVSERAGLERRRLLQWIVAWAGLSAAWFLGDGDEAGVDFGIMALATAALDR